MDFANVERVMKHLSLIGDSVSPVSNVRVVACILYKRQIISVGTSQYKTHPFQTKYRKNEHAVFLHAEVDAIYRAKRVLTEREMRKSSLFICRPKIDALTGIATYGISKPCLGCQRCIEDHGIKKVYYTNTTTDGKLSYSYRSCGNDYQIYV